MKKKHFFFTLEKETVQEEDEFLMKTLVYEINANVFFKNVDLYLFPEMFLFLKQIWA